MCRMPLPQLPDDILGQFRKKNHPVICEISSGNQTRLENHQWGIYRNEPIKPLLIPLLFPWNPTKIFRPCSIPMPIRRVPWPSYWDGVYCGTRVSSWSVQTWVACCHIPWPKHLEWMPPSPFAECCWRYSWYMYIYIYDIWQIIVYEDHLLDLQHHIEDAAF